MNRRDFFDLTARAAALAAVAETILPRTHASPLEAAKDEDFWMAIRNEFTTDRTVVNLNNGHVSPSPRTVQEAMKRYLDYSNMGPYHTMIQQLEPKVETARRMIAEAAAMPKKSPSHATPANRWKSPSSASNSRPATNFSPPIRTTPAC